jgi:hypothetical protein
MAEDVASRAAAIQSSLSREQCYVRMMRPNPAAPLRCESICASPRACCMSTGAPVA